MRKYEELWTKIKNQRSKTNSSNEWLKIKFNLDDDLPEKKKLEFRNMIVVVRALFHESNKYYPQFFLDECLYKL